MKYLIIFFVFLLIGCSNPAAPIPVDVLAELQATEKTMFNLSGDINASAASSLKQHLKNKKTGDTILIYINSNGGEVSAAEMIMTSMMGYKTICVADTAMSAAFEIFQNCTVRLYMKRSLLMVHHHWALMSGPVNAPELLMAGLDAYIQEVAILSRCAMRMGMSYVDLFKEIEKNNGEWYLYGSDIIKHNAADYLVEDYQLKKSK